MTVSGRVSWLVGGGRCGLSGSLQRGAGCVAGPGVVFDERILGCSVSGLDVMLRRADMRLVLVALLGAAALVAGLTFLQRP